MESDEREDQPIAARDGGAGADVTSPGEEPHAASATAPRGSISRRRLIAVDSLIVVSTVLLVIGCFAIWANRLLFNPDNWSNTSSQLLQNSAIRSQTANYLVDQLYANVNVAGLIRSGLPPPLQGLAAPAAGALRNAAVQGTELALMRPRVQALWAQANRVTDQAFIAVVNGGKGPVGVNQGVVTLNLGSILDNVAARLGLSSNLSTKLPPNVATLTVLKSSQLKSIQDVGKAIKGLALLLTILVPVLYAAAILLASGHRRRTLMTVGWAGVLGGVLVFLGRHILQSQIPNSLTHDAALRPAIRATVWIGTGLLSEVAGACVFVGLLLVIAAWFAGPSRFARRPRGAIAPFLSEHPGEAYAIALALLALLFVWDPIPATGTPAGIIVFTLLGLLGTYLLSRQTALELADVEVGSATGDTRETSMTTLGPSGSPTAETAQITIPEQLQKLADLRERNSITQDEYQAAKAQLLHS